jgi:hypothetical protein
MKSTQCAAQIGAWLMERFRTCEVPPQARASSIDRMVLLMASRSLRFLLPININAARLLRSDGEAGTPTRLQHSI